MSEIRFRSNVRAAYMALLSILVIGAFTLPIVISQLEIYLRKEPVPLRRTLNTIDDDLGPWDRAIGRDGKPKPDSIFGMEMIEGLGTDLYLDRLLANGDRQINVHVAYYTGMIDDVPHVPERCWDANGMTQSMSPQVFDLDLTIEGATIEDSPLNRATGEPYPRVDVVNLGEPVPVHLPIGDAKMTVTQFDPDSKKPRFKQVGGYFFIIDGRLTSSFGDLELGNHGYSCKVQLSYLTKIQSGDSDDAAVAEFVEIAEDLLPSLLPEIMRCLPDSPGIDGSAGPVESVGSPPVEATVPRK